MSLIWYYWRGDLYADEVEADCDWQSAFFWMDESDDCVIDGIELDDGTWISAEDARRDTEVVRLGREQNERYMRSARDNQYRTIMMMHPRSGDWAAVDTVKTDDAEGRRMELATRYGATRVNLR